jgi:hypothetical protein
MLPGDAGLVFPGSGTYGGAPGTGMMKFVTGKNFSGRNVAAAGTSAGAAGAKKRIAAPEDAVKRQGAAVPGTFRCPGQILCAVNRGRPDDADPENARTFAREMIRRCRTGPAREIPRP